MDPLLLVEATETRLPPNGDADRSMDQRAQRRRVGGRWCDPLSMEATEAGGAGESMDPLSVEATEAGGAGESTRLIPDAIRSSPLLVEVLSGGAQCRRVV